MQTDKIWATFQDMKFKGYLLGISVTQYQKIDRNINIVLAIAGSVSIGAWAVWKEYPIVWAGIIALSQVITTIKPFFPYNKLVKELNSRCFKIDLLNLEYEERLWNQIQLGMICENTIAERYFYFNKKCNEILNFPDDLIFEPNRITILKANQRVKTFFKNQYGVEILLT